ncbi:hypothetical protein GCM10008944_01710 [Cytobacillus oceanisediminis]
MTPSLPDVSSSPWVIYATLLLAIVIAVTTASERLAKALGPIGRAWYDFAERRRDAAVQRRGAEYGALEATVRRLDRQVKKLQTNADETARQHEAEVRELRQVVVGWERWAFAAQLVAAESGIELPDPPRHA